MKPVVPKVSAAVVVLGAVISIAAQTPGTGALSGTVVDPTERAVPSAEVIITNDDTHAVRTTTTNGQGIFRSPLLAPGHYTVQISAPGFAIATTKNVQVQVSEAQPVEIHLAVQRATAQIDVTTTTHIADTESSTLGGVEDNVAIQSLPLSSRNYTQILGLSPGVIADLPSATTLGNGTQNVAAQGATPVSNNIQFNGIDANNLLENSAAGAQNYETGTSVPAPDTIDEFRVQTSNYDAGYGRGSGANIDLISRAGGNQWHGSAWEFVRNNIFNANDFFSKLHGQPRADLKQNQFGGTLGGYIRRDRDFLFVAYQGTRQVNGLGTSSTSTLPLLTSDRSAATLGAQFCPATHLDVQGQPALGYKTSAGGDQVACDGSNISPVALALLNAKLSNGQFAVPSPQIPLPAVGPTASDQLPVGTSTFHPSAYYSEDQYTANLDQVLTTRNTLAERFFVSSGNTQLPFSPNGANVPGWGTDASSKNYLFVVADTHVFSNTTTNIARFGFTRFAGLAAAENPLSASSLGIGTPTGSTTNANMPSITVGGFSVGDGGTPSEWSVTNTFIGQDTLAFTKGRSYARFGVEVKYAQVDEDQPQQVDGNLMISSLPDFLLGESAEQNMSPLGLSNVTLSIAGGGIFRRDERYRDFAAFAQDDYKITPRLTLNLGLRYEIFGAPSDTHGRLTNFDSDLAVQGVLPEQGVFNGYAVASNFAGTIPTGVTRTPYSTYYQTPHGDVSPRVGFAWQATSSPLFVVRGGAGIYYDRHSGNLPEAMLGQAPFALSQFNSGAPNGPATLQNPFVPLVPAATSFPIFQPLMNSVLPFIEGINPNMKDGRTAEYNLNLQYELKPNMLAQIGYVGTHSDHRSGEVEFDQALLAAPGSPVNGQTINTSDNAFLRMPYQGISPGSLRTDSIFEANFNALEASLTRRFSRGLEFQASYTWSKNLDEVNGEGGTDTFELQLPTNDQHHLRQASYGLANDDRDQRLVVSAVWATPQRIEGPAFLRHALSNWQFSGIALIQSGAALSVFDGNAGSVYALLGGEVRAQLAPHANPSTGGKLFDRVVNGRYLNANAFVRAPQAPNSGSIADEDFGNSGVGIVRGPGQHSLDLAAERNFPVYKRYRFTLRAECFNLTNTPQFGAPNTQLGFGNPLEPAVASSSFGVILGEQGGPHPRILQLAGKLAF